jgi:hypothetical protein
LGIMKKGCALALAGSALLLGAHSAHAGFKLNYTVAAGTGALAGKNIFSFYARNDQTGSQAGSHTLLAMEIHFTTSDGKPFTFDFRDLDGDAKPDANIAGSGYDETNVGATFMRFGTYPQWLTTLPLAADYQTRSGANPTQKYGNLNDFYMLGFSANQTLDATQGIGRFFGAAVVPDGADVHVTGQMGAEQGTGGGVGSATPAGVPLNLLAGPDAASALLAGEAAAGVTQGPMVPVDLVARAPEPGVIGMLGAASLATLATRRRRPR